MQPKDKINFICTVDQKITMQKLAKEQGYKNLTEFIIGKCMGLDSSQPAGAKQDNQQAILELEIRYLKDKLDRSEQDLAESKTKYDITFSALLYHTLPFWRKWGKQLQLPNKPKE
jgi:hypothetical protein